MDLSDDTRNVLDFLESFSEQGLRKRNDLGLLFELSADRGAHNEMNDLLFHGTHLYNLFHTLRKATASSQGYENLEKEFSDSVERVRDHVAKALLEAEQVHIERFEVTYYSMTQGSLRNLIDLAHDLSVAKRIQNDNKYEQKNEGDSSDEN